MALGPPRRSAAPEQRPLLTEEPSGVRPWLGTGRPWPPPGQPHRRSPCYRRVVTDPASIFPGSAEDVPAVIELIGRVFGEYGFVYDPAVEVPDLLAFGQHYAAPAGAFYVLRGDRRVVGSVGVERIGDGVAELHRLYLDAHLRGQGAGRALVEAALAWCRAEAISHLVLWSDTRFDRAHRLYERMGFRRTGERTVDGDLNQSREYRYERPV
jgi:GNAT superfamily N-acetyltransferase